MEPLFGAIAELIHAISHPSYRKWKTLKSGKFLKTDELPSANLEQTDWFVLDYSCPKVMKVLVIVHERTKLLLGIEDEMPKGPLDDASRSPPGTVSFEIICAAPFLVAHGPLKVDHSDRVIDANLLSETGVEDVQDSEASDIGPPLEASFLQGNSGASTEAAAANDKPGPKRKSAPKVKAKATRRARVSSAEDQE